MVSDGWNIIEVVSTVETRVFLAELDGVAGGAAEVSPPWVDPPRPVALEMIYVVRDRRSADGPGTVLVTYLKEKFPDLSHTGVLSPKGEEFIKRHDIPRLPHRKRVRRPGGGYVEVPDEDLSESKAEDLGHELLTRACASQRLPRSTQT